MKRKDSDYGTHAERQKSEEKIHGDALDAAVSSPAEHATERQSAIPATESGGHPRSQAAHLGHVHDHTKPAGDIRALTREEEFPREPPQQISRAGKQHRRQ